MNIFEKYMSSDEAIFRNAKYLDPKCLPTKFMYRDNELATIAANISPLFYGGSPMNTLIIGDNATGKTTAIKKLFEEIKEPLPEVIPVYINCISHYTEYSVFSEIYNHVMDKEAPLRGSNSRKLFTDCMKKLELTGQSLIIALDDINYLLGSGGTVSPAGQNVIKALTRANELYGINIGIYPVITSREFEYEFNRDVSSTFHVREVCFHPYSVEEIESIIRQRVELAFYDGVISDHIISMVSNRVILENDLRLAWDILKQIGISMRVEGKLSDEDIIKIMNYVVR